MTTIRFLRFAVICAAMASNCTGVQRAYPKWRGSNLVLYGEWAAAPIVAVGEVVNVSSYGEQSIDRIPLPMAPWVHKLYWCQGDFRVDAVIKGELDVPVKRYLWASGLPGCKLWPDDPDLVFARFQTRAWFLREEGEFLRPLFDGGTHGYIGLFTKWGNTKPSTARQKLGVLLLTPSANSDNLEDYGRYLWDVARIACDLLGKKECASQIRALADLGNTELQHQACEYLKGVLSEDCTSR
jgi:hypothetical protein